MIQSWELTQDEVYPCATPQVPKKSSLFHQPEWYTSNPKRENVVCCRIWMVLDEKKKHPSAWCLFQRLFFDLNGFEGSLGGMKVRKFLWNNPGGHWYWEGFATPKWYRDLLNVASHGFRRLHSLYSSSAKISFQKELAWLGLSGAFARPQNLMKPSRLQKVRILRYQRLREKIPAVKLLHLWKLREAVAAEKRVDLFEPWREHLKSGFKKIDFKKITLKWDEMGRNRDLPCPDLPSNSNSGLV